MSDWEDEPVRAVSPGLAENFSKSVTTRTDEVSGWSDEEQQPATGGGGGGYRGRQENGDENGGYRGRRNDGGDGGGYRGRREDGGEGGFRGRREGGEGGFRGRREDGEGGFRGRREDGGEGGFRGRREGGEGGFRGRREDGGEGGFRGRRGDNEDATHLLSGPINGGLRIPSSYDMESVDAFIKDLNRNQTNQTLSKQREYRDYLIAAFTHLVNTEWATLELKMQDDRKAKARQISDAVANSQRIMAEINQLLSKEDARNQLLRTQWLMSSVPSDKETSRDTFVVPGQQSTQDPTTPRSTSTRNRTPGSTKRYSHIPPEPVQDLNSDRKLQRLRNLLKTAATKYELAGGKVEAPTSATTSNALDTSIDLSSPRRVPFANKRWLSEEFIQLHSVRQVRFCMPRELRQELSWPTLRANSVWLNNKISEPRYSMDFIIDESVSTAVEQQPNDQEQASSLINLPRQQQSVDNLDTPDYARLLQNSQSTMQNNERSAGRTTPVSAIGRISNDCLTPMQLANSGGQANSMEEDGLLMAPIPQDLPLDNDMVMTQPIVDDLGLDNATPPLLFRSRYQHASTPLQTYRPQLPAINEEHQRPSTMGRVLELSEHSPPATPSAAPAPAELSRDWSSIFRPRMNLPNYKGNLPERRLKRNRRVRRKHTFNSSENVVTDCMAQLLKTAVQEAEVPLDAEPPLNAVVAQPQTVQAMASEYPIATTVVTPTEDVAVPQTTDVAVLAELPLAAVCLEDLPERPIITNVQIIHNSVFESMNYAGNQVNQTGISSIEGPTIFGMGTPSTRLIEDPTDLALPEQRSVEERLYGADNLDDLAYIAKHADLLQLMVDHQKELSDQQEHKIPFIDDIIFDQENETGQRKKYIAMPDVCTYDPNIILAMPNVKLRVLHNLIGALIMYPQVDMRSSPFLRTRMEAAIAFRVLLELKAADFINLSKDARFASLR